MEMTRDFKLFLSTVWIFRAFREFRGCSSMIRSIDGLGMMLARRWLRARRNPQALTAHGFLPRVSHRVGRDLIVLSLRWDFPISLLGLIGTALTFLFEFRTSRTAPLANLEELIDLCDDLSLPLLRGQLLLAERRG